ncbi:hypothetical protein HC723_09145 [Vibrio sp. S11_S32]|uniref:SPOR domain-containing protein n=1 Tax=Vibrio sp. S11_S32 TaxID=2720225 RepID=UPI00168190E6|nr:SPOR domain-containing protein [Vibrio sp. S11_S32]MBD1576602.1 hypothetical protein [Vibrio sp. S11_S32]
MKKVVIISLSALLLAACSSSDYDSDVSTESYQETYKTDEVAQPITESSAAPMEQDVNAEPSMIEPAIAASDKETSAASATESNTDTNKKVVKLSPQSKEVIDNKAEEKKSSESTVRVFYPDNLLSSATQPGEDNYLVQIAALSSEHSLVAVARNLPSNQPKWENSKTVNGKQWYTLLLGNYATAQDAKDAILRLSIDMQNLKPFVKSVKAIKTSKYPELKKLPYIVK